MLRDLHTKTIVEAEKRHETSNRSVKKPSTQVLNALFNYSKSLKVYTIHKKKVAFCLN